MAGQPKTRAKLEAARAGAPAPRRKRTARLSASQRIAAVAQAEIEGTASVAERLGVTASTIRGWKHLAAKANGPVSGSKAQAFAVRPYIQPPDPEGDPPDIHAENFGFTEPIRQHAPPAGDSTDPGTGSTGTPGDAVQVMQDSALETRRLAADCMSQARNALTLGESVKVKDLSMAAQKFAQQAAELENTVQAHLEARPRLTAAVLKEMERRLRGMLGELGLDADRDPKTASMLQRWFNGATPTVEHPAEPTQSTDTPSA